MKKDQNSISGLKITGIADFIRTLMFHALVLNFALMFFPVTAQRIGTGLSNQEQIENRESVNVISEDHGNFQFAIISDLWGGNRSGIFEDAVQKLELLQPEFVMSVGDLIDGKLTDTNLINQQWEAFYRMLEPLSVPFYPVPGNHDISNPVMERDWEKRFGSSYYSFIYQDVLFMCINTQDGGSSGIGEEQIKYFREVIEKNRDVEWTFIFMHRPVWNTDNTNEEGYEKIEAALKGHEYTLFSGHHHTYKFSQKNGNKHFMLGTTGGGSDLRGEEFGEFDHITWVSFEKGKQPKIVNLKLEGIIGEDIATD